MSISKKNQLTVTLKDGTGKSQEFQVDSEAMNVLASQLASINRWKITQIKDGITIPMRNEILDAIAKAINVFGKDKMSDICKDVTEFCDTKYSGTWSSSCYIEGSGSYFVRYFKERYLQIRCNVTKLVFVVWLSSV